MSDDRPRTIRELLAASRPWLEKKGVENARLDAELLVAHALGTRRLDLFLDLDRPLSEDEIARCRTLMLRRGLREPVAQIVGEREFFGFSFAVTPDVLVPRPETEHLVEAALSRTTAEAAGAFADVCTGSGCVAIAILKNRPGLRAVATDISAAALEVAKRNADRHGVADRLELICGDLLSPVVERGGFALSFVVANPPYIRAEERAALEPEVRDHEPALALFGEGKEGLGHHARILVQADRLIDEAGFVALEIGAEQGASSLSLPHTGFLECRIEKDLAGHDRIAVWARDRSVKSS